MFFLDVLVLVFGGFAKLLLPQNEPEQESASLSVRFFDLLFLILKTPTKWPNSLSYDMFD